MGFSRAYGQSVRSYNADLAASQKILDDRDAARHKAKLEQREKLARKMVMAMTDTVINDIVRPGPIAEERECYDMAQEIRDHGETLFQLVLAILNVNEGCA